MYKTGIDQELKIHHVALFLNQLLDLTFSFFLNVIEELL